MSAPPATASRRLPRCAALSAVALLPVFLGAVFYRMYDRAPTVFASLCKEDHLVENLQFLLFLAAGISAVWLSTRFWRNGDRFIAAAYALFGAFCILIAMEEISWGQRILDFKTPEGLKKDNVQDEFNIHNLEPIQELLFLFYSLVGAFACISAVLWLVPALRRQRWFRLLSVCPCLVLYFLPVLVYGIYRLRLGSWSDMRRHFSYDQARMISLIQEPVELALAAGFLLIVIAASIMLRSEQHSDA